MNTKQKVNDKCLCGSGKKYKSCCKNKPILTEEKKSNVEVLPTHNYLHPQTLNQSMARVTLDLLNEKIQKHHCKICGDTEDDGKIFKIPTQVNDIYLCEFCYNVQINM